MGDGPRYFRVSPKFWADSAAWSDDAKILSLYLLTCPHRATEGLYRLPKAYAQADLGWAREAFDKAFDELLAVGFISYDDDAQVVLIRKALKYQAPENDNQARGAIKSLAELPETRLWPEFRQLAERYSERLSKRLAEAFGEQYGNPHLTSPQSQAHPLACEDDAGDRVSLNGFGSGLPRQPAEGRSLAGTVQDWLAEPPREHHIRPRDKRSDDYRALIEGVCEHVDMRVEGRQVLDVVHRITCEYVAEVRGEPLSDAASKQVRSFIGEYSKRPALALWGLAEAIMHGAGLSEEHAGNPHALPNYARPIIEGGLKAAS